MTDSVRNGYVFVYVHLGKTSSNSYLTILVQEPGVGAISKNVDGGLDKDLLCYLLNKTHTQILKNSKQSSVNCKLLQKYLPPLASCLKRTKLLLAPLLLPGFVPSNPNKKTISLTKTLFSIR